MRLGTFQEQIDPAERDCRSAAESVGLDPAVGFLHRDRPGRPSLALDLMEELRPVLADRLALSLLNRRQLRTGDFETRDGGAVWLSEAGRKTVLTSWQERKKEERRTRSWTRPRHSALSRICRRNCSRVTCAAILTPIRRGSGNRTGRCWCS
jgi:CRISPR-associated endonuclease Cas1